MKRRKSTASSSWSEASFRDFLHFKWMGIVADRRKIILPIVEIILAVCIAASIAFYLDPDWNVVPYPWNGVVFLVLVGVAVLIHRGTRPYRIARKMRKKIVPR